MVLAAYLSPYDHTTNSISIGSAILAQLMVIIIIIIIIKGIYIAQVRKGHKCAMSAVMAVVCCGQQTHRL